MIEHIDFRILDWIQQNLKCEMLDRIMSAITHLGDKGIFWMIAAIILLLPGKYRKCGITMLIGLLSGIVIGNLLLKNLIERSRPCWINTSVDMLINVPKDYSFPSGHTLSGFIAVTILMYYDKRMGLPALLIASLIAFSRLYLYVHFPTDVLAGMILGIALGCAAIFVTDRYLFKDNAPYRRK